jgi:hypothetical protein
VTGLVVGDLLVGDAASVGDAAADATIALGDAVAAGADAGVAVGGEAGATQLTVIRKAKLKPAIVDEVWCIH